jgi:hypothetical protein
LEGFVGPGYKNFIHASAALGLVHARAHFWDFPDLVWTIGAFDFLPVDGMENIFHSQFEFLVPVLFFIKRPDDCIEN